MKKIIYLIGSLFTLVLVVGVGCTKTQILPIEKEVTSGVVPTQEDRDLVEPDQMNSPLSALLNDEIVRIGKINSEYARVTNIRITSDAKVGFHPSSFTVVYTEEGLADDEINKSEYELKLQKQSNGSWKVGDKRLVKQECYPGRCREESAQVKTYRNDTYGFEFKYPENVIIENGRQGIYFRLKDSIITVKNKEGDYLFTLGTTGYFTYDVASKKTVLTSSNDLIPLRENCTKPFFGNKNIPSAEMSFGDGFDWSIFYSILINQNVGLGIETYRIEKPDVSALDKKAEQERIDVEKQILSTLSFVGNSKAVNFTCK